MSNKKDNLSYNNMIVLIGLSFILKGIGFVNRIVIAYYFGTNVKYHRVSFILAKNLNPAIFGEWQGSFFVALS